MLKHTMPIQYKKNDDTRPYMMQKGEELSKTYCKACHIVEIGAEKSPVAWVSSTTRTLFSLTSLVVSLAVLILH